MGRDRVYLAGQGVQAVCRSEKRSTVVASHGNGRSIILVSFETRQAAMPKMSNVAIWGNL